MSLKGHVGMYLRKRASKQVELSSMGAECDGASGECAPDGCAEGIRNTDGLNRAGMHCDM